MTTAVADPSRRRPALPPREDDAEPARGALAAEGRRCDPASFPLDPSSRCARRRCFFSFVARPSDADEDGSPPSLPTLPPPPPKPLAPLFIFSALPPPIISPPSPPPPSSCSQGALPSSEKKGANGDPDPPSSSSAPAAARPLLPREDRPSTRGFDVELCLDDDDDDDDDSFASVPPLPRV